MLDKRKVTNVIYLTFSVLLFLSLFSMLSNAIYIVPKMFTYTGSAMNFVRMYNIFSWMIFGESVLCVIVIVYNFIAKKKLNVIEIIIFAITLVAILVAIIYCSINRASAGASDLNSIFITYISSFYEYLGVIVILLISKIVLMLQKKNIISEE